MNKLRFKSNYLTLQANKITEICFYAKTVNAQACRAYSISNCCKYLVCNVSLKSDNALFSLIFSPPPSNKWISVCTILFTSTEIHTCQITFSQCCSTLPAWVWHSIFVVVLDTGFGFAAICPFFASCAGKAQKMYGFFNFFFFELKKIHFKFVVFVIYTVLHSKHAREQSTRYMK